MINAHLLGRMLNQAKGQLRHHLDNPGHDELPMKRRARGDSSSFHASSDGGRL
jgi:hypothetical protein